MRIYLPGAERILREPGVAFTPNPDETLYLYLGVSENAISSALIREIDRVQKPVYYISKTLIGAEARYSNLEKLVYALVISARKLRPYFQAHTIVVPTAHPIRPILHKSETSGRLAKWAIELGEFDVHFVPRLQ